jgi:hypothetical protein
VFWNKNKGEAEIKYSEWFTPEDKDSYTQLTMLDALTDVLAELHEIYDTVYDDAYKGIK